MDDTHSSKGSAGFFARSGRTPVPDSVRSRLATPALELLKWRIVFFSLFAWLPLLLLSLVDGKAWGVSGCRSSMT